MSIKKILYFKYVSIVLLYDRYSFALYIQPCVSGFLDYDFD